MELFGHPPPGPSPDVRHPHEGLGPTALPGETELRNRMFVHPAARWALLGGVALPLLTLLTVAAAAAAGIAPAEELFRALVGEAFHVAIFALAGLGSVVQLAQAARERLFVGPAGLRYYSGLPGWLGPLARDWSLAADAIGDVRSALPMRGAQPVTLQLVLESAAGRRKVAPFNWVEVDQDASHDFRALAGLRKDPGRVARLFDGLPLVVALREQGFAFEMPGADAPPLLELSVSSKPRTATAVVLMMCAALYGAVDMAIVTETYATGAPLGWLLGGTVFAGALAWIAIGSRETGAPARAVVALLVGLSSIVALHPGLIRINRIGAPPAEAHAYRHAESGLLEPATPASPPIDLPDLVSMLPGSAPGDLHELWIRRGILGFDQVDIDRLHAWIDGLERASHEPGSDAG